MVPWPRALLNMLLMTTIYCFCELYIMNLCISIVFLGLLIVLFLLSCLSLASSSSNIHDCLYWIHCSLPSWSIYPWSYNDMASIFISISAPLTLQIPAHDILRTRFFRTEWQPRAAQTSSCVNSSSWQRACHRVWLHSDPRPVRVAVQQDHSVPSLWLGPSPRFVWHVLVPVPLFPNVLYVDASVIFCLVLN